MPQQNPPTFGLGGKGGNHVRGNEQSTFVIVGQPMGLRKPGGRLRAKPGRVRPTRGHQAYNTSFVRTIHQHPARQNRPTHQCRLLVEERHIRLSRGQGDVGIRRSIGPQEQGEIRGIGACHKVDATPNPVPGKKTKGCTQAPVRFLQGTTGLGKEEKSPSKADGQKEPAIYHQGKPPRVLWKGR